MPRPRRYPPEIARDGAPIFTMRLAPELLAWVKEQGGSAYLRSLILQDRARQRAGGETKGANLPGKR